jgi:hypothetical protein
MGLPDNERKADMLRKLFRWSKIEHAGVLWEEFRFFKYLAGIEQEIFNIWEMPVYSGVHVESVIRRFAENAGTLRVNAIADDNRLNEFTRLRVFDPAVIFVSTTFILNKEQLSSAIKAVREFFPVVPLILGGHFVVKEIEHGFDIGQLFQVCGANTYFINSRTGEEEIRSLLGVITGNLQAGRTVLAGVDRVIKNSTDTTKYCLESWVVDFNLIEYSDRLAPMKTSVGCPFACNFCSYPVSGGSYVQVGVDITLKQLLVLRQRGVRMLVFTDDTLNVPPEKFKQLLKGMINNGLTDFQCFSFCRCQFLTEEIVGLMKQCGFSGVLLGIESGSAKVLEHMNKKATPVQYLKGISQLKEQGVTTFGAIMIGHPGETLDTVNETVDFLNQSGLDYCYVQPFYYLHNTPIHQMAEKYELTGEGLRWKHKTMTSPQCLDLLDELAGRIKGPVYCNEEYAMWEMMYFLYKGYSKELYRDYRLLLHSMRNAVSNGGNVMAEQQERSLRDFRLRHSFCVKDIK